MEYKELSHEQLIEKISDLEKEILKLKKTEFRERERNKELNCLYSISKIFGDVSFSLSETIQQFVNTIPSGLQYPDITCARAVLNEYTFESENFSETLWKIDSEIIVYNNQVGILEIFYTEKRPLEDFGPFLKEEVSLLKNLAEELGWLIERYEAQNRITNALRDKEILLSRIKNNLEGLSQLIQSPLNNINFDSVLDFDSNKTDREKLVDLLEVLSNSDRFKIFDYLRTISLNLTEIMDLIDKSQSTTNHHLKMFRKLGIITGWKQRKLIYYSINQQKLNDFKKSWYNWFESMPIKIKKIPLKNIFKDESEIRDFLMNVFSVLGNQERFLIYDELKSKKHSISSLENVINKAQSTIHHHIQQLKEADLIEGESDGKFTIYTINKKTFNLLYNAVDEWFGSITNWVRRTQFT